jgi:hypothetical protein
MSMPNREDKCNEVIWEEIKACSYKQKHAILIQRGIIYEGEDLTEMELNELCYEHNIYASEIQQY